jgi:hypothetical protein
MVEDKRWILGSDVPPDRPSPRLDSFMGSAAIPSDKNLKGIVKRTRDTTASVSKVDK